MKNPLNIEGLPESKEELENIPLKDWLKLNNQLDNWGIILDNSELNTGWEAIGIPNDLCVVFSGHLWILSPV